VSGYFALDKGCGVTVIDRLPAITPTTRRIVMTGKTDMTDTTRIILIIVTTVITGITLLF